MPVMGYNWNAFCLTKLVELANRRESPVHLFDEAANRFWNSTSYPGELAISYSSAALVLIQSFKRDFGFTWSGPDSAWLNGDVGDAILEINKAFVSNDPKELGRVLSALSGAFYESVKAAPEGWTCSLSVTPKPDTKNPLEISIVAMPARETSTEIKRDVGNNIVMTKQVEKDAA
jgi:hypothetical protein